MFTGIVTAIGTIESVEQSNTGEVLRTGSVSYALLD